MIEMAMAFRDTSNLTSLDLSNWDTSNVNDMNHMFWGARSLNRITIGQNFDWTRVGHFPEINQTVEYTGYWQNVGTGTIAEPNGENILTSTELIEQFDSATMADTFVWQRRSDYAVQWGDTLSELAVRFQTTVETLTRMNSIENPDFILIGQILELPRPVPPITVRFYYYDTNIDPQVMLIEEAWRYISMDFGNNRYFWGHFVLAMYEETGIEILKIYDDEGVTHINLAQTERQRFNEGSTGVALRSGRLMRTLASIPYVTEIRILIDGQRDVLTNHASFHSTFILQDDGSWKRHE